MRTSKTLGKLSRNEIVRICGLGHYVPPYVRYAANFGFDCIWLDLEHRAMDNREIQALLAFCHLFDIDCMLRPPSLERTQLYRYLEDGATGLLIPLIDTADQARELVRAVKFPPLGNRGIDGAGLDTEFSLPDPVQYSTDANRETFLILQIETIEAVRNVDEILAIEGIDGVFVGPADLGLRIRVDDDCPFSFEEARQQVAQSCQRHGKAWGQPARTEDDLKMLHQLGARILAHGGEYLSFIRGLEQAARSFGEVE